MEERVYSNDLTYPKEAKKCLVYRIFGQVPARLVLYLLSWSGFLVSFMMRNDINLAIVAMVAEPPHTANSSAEYCFVVEDNNNTAPLDYGGTLNWSGPVQSYVLASFYWAYIVSQIVGGLATQKLGTKRVFGYSQLATALSSLCIPIAAESHFGFVIALRFVQGFASNGLLSGAPFICSYIASVFFCYIADKLVTGNYMSLTNVRKLMTALSQVVPGALVPLVSYLGCDIELVLVVWFIAVTMITASYAGAMANIVDIAPNFAGPVLAFAQTIHMTASFLSPLANFQMLDKQEHLMSAWRTVFYVSCLVACVTYVSYQMWGTGDIQPWNESVDDVDKKEVEELVKSKNDVEITNGLGSNSSSKENNSHTISRNDNIA
ncbi:hypothetical protein HUJ05_006249 [Dendroctonus ponderosae]|nr:hypothetical protein HUJ05_006249 [Dendroctonus ponderosae]